MQPIQSKCLTEVKINSGLTLKPEAATKKNHGPLIVLFSLFLACISNASEPFFIGEWEGRQDNTNYYCNVLFTYQSDFEYSHDHFFYVPFTEGLGVEKYRSGSYGQYSLVIYDETNGVVIEYQRYNLWFFIDAINRTDRVSTHKKLLLTDLDDTNKFENKQLPTVILSATYNLDIQPLTDETFTIGMVDYETRHFKSCTVMRKENFRQEL